MSKNFVKTEDEIERLRESGKRLAYVLDRLIERVVPGMSTLEIDTLAEELIRKEGGIPIFKGYGAESGTPFPATLCISLNHEVVHGIPRADCILKEGDLLKLDIGMRFEGMVTDMARTVPVGKISEEAAELLRVTKESLDRGIGAMRSGVPLSEYSRAVQEHVEAHGFSIVRDLVGHGVGHELHEEPQVPNYISRRMSDIILQKNMVLALEPMVNAGTFEVDIAPDDWTFITADGRLSAHFEDTVVITEKGVEIVTRP